jgi:hypothetical protein
MFHHLVVLVKEDVIEVHMEEEVEDMVMEEDMVTDMVTDMVMENIVTCKEDMVTVKVQEVEAEVEKDQEDMVVDHLIVDLVLHLTQADHQVLEEEEEDIEVNVVLVVDHLE